MSDENEFWGIDWTIPTPSGAVEFGQLILYNGKNLVLNQSLEGDQAVTSTQYELQENCTLKRHDSIHPKQAYWDLVPEYSCIDNKHADFMLMRHGGDDLDLQIDGSKIEKATLLYERKRLVETEKLKSTKNEFSIEWKPAVITEPLKY